VTPIAQSYRGSERDAAAKNKHLDAYLRTLIQEKHRVQIVMTGLRMPAPGDSVLGLQKKVVMVVSDKGLYCLTLGRFGVSEVAARPYKKYRNALVLPGTNHKHEASESLARSMHVWISPGDVNFAFERSNAALQIFSYRRNAAYDALSKWLQVTAVDGALDELSQALVSSITAYEAERLQEREDVKARGDEAWASELVEGVLAGSNWIAPWERNRLAEMRNRAFARKLQSGLAIISAAEQDEDLTDDQLSQLADWRPELHAAYLKRQAAKIRAASTPPDPLPIRSPHDAELVACTWMRYWGFSDARTTSGGADGGIDVTSTDAVAQVKAHMTPVGRPDLQAFLGAAAVEKKIPLFFSLNGYTDPAIEWADRAGIALFTYDLLGQPDPCNEEARRYPCGE
jgi:hypothetical protein